MDDLLDDQSMADDIDAVGTVQIESKYIFCLLIR